MKLKKLEFKIVQNLEMTRPEKEYLIEAYHQLNIVLYGYDLVDSYEIVTQSGADKKEVLKYAINYSKSLELLEEVNKNANLELLIIYYDNKLVGASRLKRIDEDNAKVLDVALNGLNKEEKRGVWKQTIMFVENYFTNLGYKKMYVEIPLKENALLIRADDLGFRESPEDIVVDKDVNTYILNKTLEVNNGKFDNSCK